MVQSIFDVYKTSLGPSSSHTTGPMKCARDFSVTLQEKGFIKDLVSLKVKLFGSLAATGKGHGTNKAIILGLMGYTPESVNPYEIEDILHEQEKSSTLSLLDLKKILFSQKSDLIFDLTQGESLFHPNTMQMIAFGEKGETLYEETYYSVGGGEILKERDRHLKDKGENESKIPYPFQSGAELFSLCAKTGLSIAELTIKNESPRYTPSEVFKKLDFIMKTMEDCIKKGCSMTGVLPGGLKVKRRANGLFEKLKAKIAEPDNENDPTSVLDWVNLYALAVNEENASGSKIITAPTNGAAGVLPAVLQYYKKHITHQTKKGMYDFLLTAGSIGLLYMKRASISGAEVGCQGEVGVACSMAAGGLAAALGGSIIQIEKAAEIGMEHNLGLTCDPIAGLVQIPCIERNAMASIKAINACRLALVTNEPSHVSLDDVIKTMYQTGLDMKTSYKETSLGGLAVNVKNC
jgi:L-serine dehydratase